MFWFEPVQAPRLRVRKITIYFTCIKYIQYGEPRPQPYLLVGGARRDLAAIRAESHAVDEVGVLAVVGVVHLEGRALVENRPVVLAARHDAVGSGLPVVAADHPLAVAHHLSEVAPGVPHESASVHARPRPANHDPLALGSPRKVLDSPAQAKDFDLQLVFRVVPRPDPHLFPPTFAVFS